VLPFVNLSNDPQQEYFSDGITDDIITELSRFSELFVIARNSSCTSQKYQLPACNSHMPAKPWVASIECVVIEGNMRLDPFYPPLATAWLGLAHYMLKRYAEALPPLRECTSRAPNLWFGHLCLAVIYAQLGRLQEAH
jgi:hypothetical protein